MELIRKNKQMIVKDQNIKAIKEIVFSTHPYKGHWQAIGKSTQNNKELIFDDPLPEQRLYYQVITHDSKQIVAERRVNLVHSFNMRDLGGYLGADDRPVKWGLFFRSDDLSSLDARDRHYLEAMGIRSIVDYRSEWEKKKHPNQYISNTQTYDFSPNAKVAALASSTLKDDQEKVAQLVSLAASNNGRKELVARLDEMAQQMEELVAEPYAITAYREMLQLLEVPEKLPMIQHCRGGKDRTGWGAALILFILGVSEDTIMEDYLYTKKVNTLRNQKRMAEYQQYTDNAFVLDYLYSLMDTKESYFIRALDKVKELSGDIDTYLAEYLGISAKKKQMYQKLYLESEGKK
ncbi:tyrosine-protein phosphatase [Enterococcus crotali]|uniref:tyrosine-protein phosphatase n=1 Tax=Enterococcus crotali TaxID=1453587 RepID=UPI00046FC674|nr:tyrosine-protein phosphatase [Enterococcus crotali]